MGRINRTEETGTTVEEYLRKMKNSVWYTRDVCFMYKQ